MKIQIDTTGRVEKILDPSYIGEQLEEMVEIPDPDWQPSIIGYEVKEVSKKDPMWERPQLLDDAGKPRYEKTIEERLDDDWVPKHLMIDGTLQYEEYDDVDIKELDIDVEKYGRFDKTRPIMEPMSNRPMISVEVDDLDNPILDMSLNHPMVNVEVEDKSKPIYEDESKRPTISSVKYTVTMPENVITIDEVPEEFDGNTCSLFRFKDDMLTYVGGTKKIDNIVNPRLTTIVTDKLVPTIDSLGSTLKTILAEVDMGSDQDRRYLAKFKVAKRYKDGNDIDHIMPWFKYEASVKGIDVEDLIDYIITMGNKWESMDELVDISLDSIRVSINETLKDDPYLAYSSISRLTNANLSAFITDVENPLGDILDGLKGLL